MDFNKKGISFLISLSILAKTVGDSQSWQVQFGGAKENRTPDLLNAI